MKFTPEEIAWICTGLDMVREERDDEYDVIIRAIKTPDFEKMNDMRLRYEEKKSEFGVMISKLKEKVKKLK